MNTVRLNKAKHSMNYRETKCMDEYVHAYLDGIKYAIDHNITELNSVNVDEIVERYLIENDIIDRGTEEDKKESC